MKAKVGAKTPWKVALAAKVLAARGKLSQAEVAGNSGVSDRTISLIEKGNLQKPPRADTVARIAIATGQDPEEWLSIIGAKLDREQIESLRTALQVFASPRNLEPAEAIKNQLRKEIREAVGALEHKIGGIEERFELPGEIKRELRQYFNDQVDTHLATYQPANKIKQELMEYVNARISYLEIRVEDLRRLFSDLRDRVDQLRDIRPAGAGNGPRME